MQFIPEKPKGYLQQFHDNLIEPHHSKAPFDISAHYLNSGLPLIITTGYFPGSGYAVESEGSFGRGGWGELKSTMNTDWRCGLQCAFHTKRELA